MNIRLPAQIPPSSASVVLSGNNTSSQANVTVATDRMAPLMRGSRILGIDVNMAENNSYNDALQISRGAGSGAVSLSLNWDGIETQPGHYDLTFLMAEVATLRGTGVSLSLRIRPVDTNGSHIPADLQSRPFFDPAAIQRFCALMDAVMTTLQGAGPMNAFTPICRRLSKQATKYSHPPALLSPTAGLTWSHPPR